MFVAVSVPEEAKSAIASAVAPWRLEFSRARWTPPENWHVTLKFLGATWPRLVEWVQEQVAIVAAEASAFQTRVDGLGAFPSAGRARVLWAGLEDPDERTARLVSDLDAALAKEFRAQTRAFHPHLTVARSDPPLHLPETFWQTRLRTEVFRVDRLVLFRSHLRRPAPLYEQLASYPLGGG